MTSCSGCHLPQEQNAKSPMQHYEGTETRNYASYNPQVIRTDAFMLGGTLRQLVEIWRLDRPGTAGTDLVQVLKAELRKGRVSLKD
mgnify:CR=1 FL=1